MLRYGLLAGGGLFCTKLYFMGGVNHHTQDLTGKVVLVTGGNSGIGREAARKFYDLNANVIITGRDSKKAKKFLKELDKPSATQSKMDFIQVDFSDLGQVKKLAEDLKAKHQKLDLLVNNAGCNFKDYHLPEDGVETTMKVNHLAPTYLTFQLLPLLENAEKARIVNVASIVHKGTSMGYAGPPMEPNFDNYWDQTVPKFDPLYTYSQSKLANVFFTTGLQKYLDRQDSVVHETKGRWGSKKKEEKPVVEARNIKTVCLHPGVVDTGLMRNLEGKIPFYRFLDGLLKPITSIFMKSSLDGAQTTLYCSLLPFDKLQEGEYYADCEVAQKSEPALDPKNVERCWEMTNKKIKEITGDEIFN